MQNQTEILTELVQELGINTLDADKQNEFLIKMTEVLLKRIFLETMEKLGEEGRREYEEISEGDGKANPEQVEEFFKEHISNYDEMVKKVIVDFKDEMTRANAER